jgi:hypothetical protein
MKLETEIKIKLEPKEKEAFEIVSNILYDICLNVCDCDFCPLKRFCDTRFDCMITMPKISEVLSES